MRSSKASMTASSIGGLQHAREFHLFDAQLAAPTRLILEAVLKRVLSVFLAEVDVDCFGIAGFD
jgi:hypothetical protein